MPFVSKNTYNNDQGRLLRRIQESLDLPAPQDCGRVAVAMSGGVDSSTTAQALSHLGYQVVGITLKLYESPLTGRPGTCCAGKDIADAQKAAHEKGFPHYVLDYTRHFQESVINPFTHSYRQGQTPIPCVLCNQTVKFRDMLSYARSLGCVALVTGHYIQRLLGPRGPILARGVDPSKDQSYFLFTTTKDELDYLRFPLGGLLKSETRALGEHLGLSLAQKKESQDICFVAGGRYADFIHKIAPETFTPGEILHINGQTIGQHNGIAHYTVGQRRGLGISAGEPLFVVDIDAHQHTVTVGPKEALLTHDIFVHQTNWLACTKELLSLPIKVRLRSSGEHYCARSVFDFDQKTAVVSLDIPAEGIAPGQACVFYHNDRLLGGGWIQDTSKYYTKSQGPSLCTSSKASLSI